MGVEAGLQLDTRVSDAAERNQRRQQHRFVGVGRRSSWVSPRRRNDRGPDDMSEAAKLGGSATESLQMNAIQFVSAA
jgi:hypothetical protein